MLFRNRKKQKQPESDKQIAKNSIGQSRDYKIIVPKTDVDSMIFTKEALGYIFVGTRTINKDLVEIIFCRTD